MPDAKQILLSGYLADRTFAHTIARLDARGVSVTVLDLAQYLETATVLQTPHCP